MLEHLQGELLKRCVTCDSKFGQAQANCPEDGTVLIPIQIDPWVGKKLTDHYEILSLVGHGGMGAVYKAKHDLMDRFVAVKMLLSQHISDAQSVRRFQHEARAASKLSHPNIITLYDYGVSATGQPYLVMDYLEGISLADIIKSDGQIGAERSVKMFLQVCDALEHAHNQKLVHRDLKPGNIMLVNNDSLKDYVKVVDFGVSKIVGADDAQRLTITGDVCGSPVYMSPEQCEGKKLDRRSDIYSMGVLMYEALTGELPLMGKTMVETMSKHLNEKPPRFQSVRPDLYIPERLENVVFHCLEKKPADRPQSMAALREELQYSIPQARPIFEIPEYVKEPLPKSSKAKSTASVSKLQFAFVYLLLACAIAAFLVASTRWRQVRPKHSGTVVSRTTVPVQKTITNAVKPKALPKAKPAVKLPIATPATVKPQPAPKAKLPRKVTKQLATKKHAIKPSPPKTDENPWQELELQSSGHKYTGY